jgi:probable HAF family extracellular repeat protein
MTKTHRNMQSLVLAASLSAGPGFVLPAYAQDHSYLVDLNSKTVTEIGSLQGGGESFATGINDTGQVIGSSASHAFITGPNGVGITDLGTLGGIIRNANGINASGQLAGDSTTAKGDSHAFITGPNGMGIKDLGGGIATGINDVGQVIGSLGNGAFITGPNDMGMTDLGPVSATGINAAGQVTGYFNTASGDTHAFITGPNGVGMTDLGTLGRTYSSATGINAAG